MKDIICLAVIVSSMIVAALTLGCVSYILFNGYFVTGEVYGVASGIKDLFGGVFYAVVTAVVAVLAFKMLRA